MTLYRTIRQNFVYIASANISLLYSQTKSAGISSGTPTTLRENQRYKMEGWSDELLGKTPVKENMNLL